MNERSCQQPISPEEEAHFRLLKAIEQHPEFSQRELAQVVGMSLGRTNYVIRALVEKGFLKLGRLLQAESKLKKAAYILTSAGLGHRIALTQAYIERKKAEYETLKGELEKLQRELPEAFDKQK